ncbi:alkaline phosphatase [Erwinia typographi]|uniref:Alkaline phosphatase n=1 Tax=Erwinia typographi TaxID=371042 RepID=A0A0A3Z6B4_9GAMM|nr:aminopeptidase [Erwinia typographi]KGT93304.1 alkaline phosphatase [Erwinia typographi]
MFSRLRLRALAVLLSCGAIFPLQAASQPEGHFAEQQLRHIATYFPGRMAGSPAEMLAADYLQHQFSSMGYESNKRNFNASYQYRSQDGRLTPGNVTATSVIAARAGKVPQQIVIVTHTDTYLPLSDSDRQHNLGGLTLQGADDNASGLGVMLELAQRLSKVPLHYSLRFVALSGEESGHQGEQDYLDRLKPEEKKNTLLVISLDSLIVGDKLYFDSGSATPKAVARQTRDRALAIARQYGLAATTSGEARKPPAEDLFDKAGFPLLSVRAANWDLGNKDGQQQRAASRHFPQGTSRHQASLDNLAWLDRWLPGRITQRTRTTVKILLPLISELANPKSAI